VNENKKNCPETCTCKCEFKRQMTNWNHGHYWSRGEVCWGNYVSYTPKQLLFWFCRLHCICFQKNSLMALFYCQMFFL